jgi:hypothetical protein
MRRITALFTAALPPASIQGLRDAGCSLTALDA